MLTSLNCTACGSEHFSDQSRGLRIVFGGLWLDKASDVDMQNDEAVACGQRCVLILTERYLERGTFALADHNAPPASAPALPADEFAELT